MEFAAIMIPSFYGLPKAVQDRRRTHGSSAVPRTRGHGGARSSRDRNHPVLPAAGRPGANHNAVRLDDVRIAAGDPDLSIDVPGGRSRDHDSRLHRGQLNRDRLDDSRPHDRAKRRRDDRTNCGACGEPDERGGPAAAMPVMVMARRRAMPRAGTKTASARTGRGEGESGRQRQGENQYLLHVFARFTCMTPAENARPPYANAHAGMSSFSRRRFSNAFLVSSSTLETATFHFFASCSAVYATAPIP